MWLPVRWREGGSFTKKVCLCIHLSKSNHFNIMQWSAGLFDCKSSWTHTSSSVLQLLMLVSLGLLWLWLDGSHILTLNWNWDLPCWVGDKGHSLCHAAQLGWMRSAVVGALKALLRCRLGRHLCAVLVWLRRDIRSRLWHWLGLRHLRAWLLAWLLCWQNLTLLFFFYSSLLLIFSDLQKKIRSKLIEITQDSTDKQHLDITA